MNNRVVVVAIILFVIVVTGMFTFAYLKKSEIRERTTDIPPPSQPEAGPYDSITRVDAKHFFIDGKHTLVGEIVLPTPCDLLDWSAPVAESMPEQVTVHFKVINTAETCVAQVTNQRFKVDFSASKDASISATFMGRGVELNLIPASESEKPDDFEIFIKG